MHLWTPLLWMPRRQGPASLMVPVWPAVLWMEMRLGALRVPRRQWPASRGLPRRLEVLKALWMLRRQGRASLMLPVSPAVLWMGMQLGALRVPRRQWPASRGLPRRLGG